MVFAEEIGWRNGKAEELEVLFLVGPQTMRLVQNLGYNTFRHGRVPISGQDVVFY